MSVRKFFLGALLLSSFTLGAQEKCNVQGRIIDMFTRKPIPDVTITMEGRYQIGAVTDSLGHFLIENVPVGYHAFQVSAVGYHPLQTPDYNISKFTPAIHIELEEHIQALDEVVVRPSPYLRTPETPLSVQVITLRDIERTPGGNRDLSRIVRNYPGVSYSPIGYRNDLIVRGGGPSENRFYLDGIEIPNLNHFATQGASGGPVSLINADLIREVKFYTGAFPANRSGALSSVLDVQMKEGDPDRQIMRLTLGFAEASLSGNGHFSEKTTYIYSVRQSYLQALFKLLKLPILPNYIDGQFLVKSRLSPTDELTFMGLAGIDRMKLNEDLHDESSQYIVSYLPLIRQDTYTLGAKYRHFSGHSAQTIILSHSFLKNRNHKYLNNDESRPENLMLDMRSVETKTALRFENRFQCSPSWVLKQSLEFERLHYTYSGYRLLPIGMGASADTNLHIYALGGAFSAEYQSKNDKLKASLGARADGNTYSSRMKQFWHQFSPRASLRYDFSSRWALSASSGIYYQLPPLVSLGYADDKGVLKNKELDYMKVWQSAMGLEWKPLAGVALTAELFYKQYRDIPLSVADGIPLTCKGNEFGVVGNEQLLSQAQGRSYGMEWMFRTSLPQNLNLTGSFTWYRSEYRSHPESPYVASSWDNRFIFNLTTSYDFPHHWCVGAKFSWIGGAPYTPYDEDKSSLVTYWNAAGQAYRDYSRYNTLRLPSYAQLDLRLDKDFYFNRWRMGFYISLQNVTHAKNHEPDALMSTGRILNPDAPITEQRYEMKKIQLESGSIIPSFGFLIEF